MQPVTLPSLDIFVHIRIVLGVVIGLGFTRLLSGLARIVQDRRQGQVYVVHLGWMGSMLLALALFWWFEIRLYQVEVWAFGTYVLLLLFAITFFLQCAILCPDNLQGYRNYEDYFHAQRGWFFGLLAANSVLDIADTLIKGERHFSALQQEYLIRTPAVLLLCLVGALSASRHLHALLVIAVLGYQVSFIWRLYGTLH